MLTMFSRVFLLAVCDPSPYGFDSQCVHYSQPIPTTSTSSTKALERWEDKHVCLLIASYMKFKDEFGKSHITQQSMRSNFWFGRVPVRVVSDRSVRYNGRHPRLHLPWVPEAFHARFPVSVKSLVQRLLARVTL